MNYSQDSQILFYDLLVRNTLQAMRYSFREPRKCEGKFLKMLGIIVLGILCGGRGWVFLR